MFERILIYNSGGGLGDALQILPIILSLKNHFKQTKFFYLCSHGNHFDDKLKDYNLKISSLNLKIKYFGFRFWHYFIVKKNYNIISNKKFDLIIDLQSKLRNTIILKKIPHNLFYSKTLNYTFSSIKKKNYSDDILENLSFFLNTKIEKKDFNINTIDRRFIQEADRLLPENNYIGLSLTQGNEYRKKSWQISNFITLSKKLIEINKKPVFFINNNEKIINILKTEVPEAIFPEIESNLSGPTLVTALASKLEKAVSIDNGVMHMMGLAKIPMILLFGPTNSEKFAPRYNGIKVLDSKKIYKSDNINLITVKDVINEI